MEYFLLQPPFSLQFKEMKKQELLEYCDWFVGAIPSRLAQLESIIQASTESSGLVLDATASSLDKVGLWLAGRVKTRMRDATELEELNKRLVFSIDGSSRELTNESFSLAIDVGMYLAHVFLSNFRSLRWSQDIVNERSVDYGQPVLTGFLHADFNPARMVINLCYGLADGTRNGKSLRGVYDYWSKRVKKS